MRFYLILIAIIALAGVAYSLASRGPAPAAGTVAGASAMPAVDGPHIDLLFTYGSEKEAWINQVTAAFHASKAALPDGRRIRVQTIATGSGDCVDEVLSGRRQAHLISPASEVFITLGNAEARRQFGKDLIASSDHLVLSPVVIAMWKPMAEALGWPAKAIGWKDILALARAGDGWAARGRPEFGRFRFGHTHPDYSNSGLISVLAETYAATGKTSGLTIEDLAKPEVASFLAGIEGSIIHYGSSTGFFAKKMIANGPDYLSAAVLYESSVIESASDPKLRTPLVAIYPSEGTFWSDHPCGIVERDWVTPDHRAAAKQYISYLMSGEPQRMALAAGFRPGDPRLAVGAPIDAGHGADPTQPATTLPVPSAEVINAARALWQTTKKPANIVLVIDTSGSMVEEGRMVGARAGALRLIEKLSDRDQLSLLPFSSQPRWAIQDVAVGAARSELNRNIGALQADGGTALYDAIDLGFQHMLSHPAPDRINAMVVLTDGADRDSRLSLESLLGRIAYDRERRTIRVFTIAYGAGAEQAVLKQISEATHARSYAGDAATIETVFKEIATFF